MGRVVKGLMLMLIGVVVGIVLTTFTLQTVRVESNGEEVNSALITLRVFGTEQVYALDK